MSFPARLALLALSLSCAAAAVRADFHVAPGGAEESSIEQAKAIFETNEAQKQLEALRQTPDFQSNKKEYDRLKKQYEDLAQQFKGAYPVPTYVGEFLIGRYCATTDPEEIEEGLQVVRRLLSDRTVRAGEEELFKSRARERMTVKLIDLVKARLDAKSDVYLAELPSLGLKDARIEDALDIGLRHGAAVSAR